MEQSQTIYIENQLYGLFFLDVVFFAHLLVDQYTERQSE